MKKEFLLNQQPVVKVNTGLKITSEKLLTTTAKSLTKQGAGVQPQWKVQRNVLNNIV